MSPSTSSSTALPEPCVALLVAGGHSSLLLVSDVTGRVERLGATIDDAAGEAFDKVARLLGLPFPVARTSTGSPATGGSVSCRLPAGLSLVATGAPPVRLSFSGLKTAVARWVEARERSGEPVPVADVAASFQEAVCDVLTRKAVEACVATGAEHLVIGGGVAANSRLRFLAEERAQRHGLTVRVPRPGLCTDNGAMVAALGSGAGAAQPAGIRTGHRRGFVDAGDQRGGMTEGAVGAGDAETSNGGRHADRLGPRVTCRLIERADEQDDCSRRRTGHDDRRRLRAGEA